ncbi:WD40/YVTN/BNR-like repeat-containing protein [Fluviispira vulneris]|uniref:WD40/YVTN/BNR-like repeat-containing protein n=1 Tax=Fluviispira vulneris TaxID=2763012 RepID=UPI00164558C1|nr:hypothetical protein [Fluviispira vulneris]
MKVKSYCVVVLFFCFLLNSCKQDNFQTESTVDSHLNVGLSIQTQSKEIPKNNIILEGFYGEGCNEHLIGKEWKLFGSDQIHEKTLALSTNDVNCKIYLRRLKLIINNIITKYNVMNNGKKRYLLSDKFSKKFLEFTKVSNSQGDFDDKIFAKVMLNKGDSLISPTVYLQLRRVNEFDYSIQGKNIEIDYSREFTIKELAHEAIYRVYPYGNGIFAVGYKNVDIPNSQIKTQGGLFYTSDFLKNNFKKIESIRSEDVRNMAFDNGYIYAANYGGNGGLYYTTYDDILNFKIVRDPMIINKKIIRVAASGRNIYVLTNDNSLFFTTEGVNGTFKKVHLMPGMQINSLLISENKVIIASEKNIFYTNDLTSGIFYKNKFELEDEYISEIAVNKNIVILGGKDGIYISKDGVGGKFYPQQELRDNEIYNLFIQENYIYASVLCKTCGYNLKNNLKSEKNKNIDHTDGIYLADLHENPIIFRKVVPIPFPMSFTLFKDKALISSPSGLSYFEDSK